MKQKSIAIVTARGGSKRIPGKNIKEFCGKPIIAYSIIAAKESGIFEEIMVSTDDKRIAEIADDYGANVPFLRSKETSNDYATTVDVLLEVLAEYEKQGKTFDKFCCIYPTAPFITADKIKRAASMLQDADSVIPIVCYSFPPQRSVRLEEKNVITWNYPECEKTRSQDLQKWYHDCGQFYFVKTKEFLMQKTLVMKNTIGMEVPEMEVQDIDTSEDWMLAEIKYQNMKKKHLL